MSMYELTERNGQPVVIDRFSRQPVSEEETVMVIATLQKPTSTPRVEETEKPKTQDTKA